MINLDLTREEQDTLKDILESTLSELRAEIADTDRKDFRDDLKRQKAILNKVVTALSHVH